MHDWKRLISLTLAGSCLLGAQAAQAELIKEVEILSDPTQRNDTLATAQALTCTVAASTVDVSGIIGTLGDNIADVDVFSFEGTAGDAIKVTVSSFDVSTWLLYHYTDVNGVITQVSRLPLNLRPTIDINVTATGTQYVALSPSTYVLNPDGATFTDNGDPDDPTTYKNGAYTFTVDGGAAVICPTSDGNGDGGSGGPGGGGGPKEDTGLLNAIERVSENLAEKHPDGNPGLENALERLQENLEKQDDTSTTP